MQNALHIDMRNSGISSVNSIIENKQYMHKQKKNNIYRFYGTTSKAKPLFTPFLSNHFLLFIIYTKCTLKNGNKDLNYNGKYQYFIKHSTD